MSNKEAKMDLTLSRALTINAGNYESIRPSVDITLKDVNVANLSEVYMEMTTILEGLMKLEIARCSGEISDVKAAGLKKHVSNIVENTDKIGEIIDTSVCELYKYIK